MMILRYKNTSSNKDLYLKVPLNSFERFSEIFLSRDISKILTFIEENISYIDEDLNNIAHICFICSPDLFTLQYCLDVLIDKKVNFNHLNQRQYVPLQTLIINNPKFYENNLGRILPQLFKIYSLKDFKPLVSSLHLFYVYDGFCSFTKKQEFYDFLLKEVVKDKSFEYPKVLAGKEFLDHEKIKLFPPEGVLETHSFLNNKNLSDCVFEITRRKSKSFKRIVVNEIINKKYLLLDSIMTICKSIDNDDVCLKIIKEFVDNHYSPFEGEMYYLNQRMIPSIRDFVSIFTPHLFIKYFLKDDYRDSYTKDTLFGFSKLKDSYDTILDVRNYRNLKEYHDAISKEITKNKQKPFKLNQDSIYYLNNKEMNEFKIYVPECNHDLILVGTELNLCIGTFGYAERIAQDIEKMIFFKDKHDRVKIVCNMDNNFRIKEIKKHNNAFLSKIEEVEIQNFLFQNKK